MKRQADGAGKAVEQVGGNKDAIVAAGQVKAPAIDPWTGKFDLGTGPTPCHATLSVRQLTQIIFDVLDEQKARSQPSQPKSVAVPDVAPPDEQDLNPSTTTTVASAPKPPKKTVHTADCRKTANISNSIICTVDRVCGHYVIRTSDCEQAILDEGYAAYRLLLLVANVGTDVPLANVFHADERHGPYIIDFGKSVLRNTGLGTDGIGSLSYKVLHGRDAAYIRELREKIKENRLEQDEAKKRGDEVRLGNLEDELDKYVDELRVQMHGTRSSPYATGDDGHSASDDVHAAYMSIMRAVKRVGQSAPRLADHLKQNVKCNGIIRYEKVVGWKWDFLFPLELVNLIAGDVRDAEDND